MSDDIEDRLKRLELDAVSGNLRNRVLRLEARVKHLEKLAGVPEVQLADADVAKPEQGDGR